MKTLSEKNLQQINDMRFPIDDYSYRGSIYLQFTRYFCLSNAIHCMGQNIKSLAACFCVCFCVCAHRFWGPNISKTV